MPPGSPIARFFHPEQYLARYADVCNDGGDPLEHYLAFGAAEARLPNDYFDPEYYRAAHMDPGDHQPAIEHFVTLGASAGHRPHFLIDPIYVAREYGIAVEDVVPELLARDSKIDVLCEWFACTTYRMLHPDVAAANLPSFRHFIDHGLLEGRSPYPGIAVTAEERRAPSSQPDVPVEIFSFAWQGVRYVVERTSLPASIVDQVVAQGQLEPQVYSPGALSLPFLVQTEATNIRRREGFDHRVLLDAIGERPEVLILHPGLCVGGAEKYTAQLVRTLDRELGIRPLVLTTNASEEDDGRAMKFDILRPLRSTRLVSLWPHFREARDPIAALALLWLALAPKHVFVINSQLALDALRRHGRALGNASNVLVSFFSESPLARGGPYSSLYLLDVIEHARVFADNRVVLELLSRRLGGQVSERFVHLPQSVELSSEDAFRRSLEHRRRWRQPARPPRLLWVSRWSAFKATDVLTELAKLRPDIHIDVYGVPEDAGDFPSLPNMHRHPPAFNLSSLPLPTYDAFVFTSQFEGMPNIVLEMAGHGVPIVSSDVGGLRESFDDETVDFVTMTSSPLETAACYADALQRVCARSEDDTASRLHRARAVVSLRHSSQAFANRLDAVLAQAAAEEN